MKRLLLLGILQLVMFGICAQTSVDTALPLIEGNNSFAFENATGQNTVYYVYTAPVDQGKLLTVEKTAASTNITLSEDGSYTTGIIGIINGNTGIYPIKKGQSVFLSASVYNENSVSFKASLTDADVEGGAACENAITGGEADFFVPSYYDRQSYQTNPTFISYHSLEDGVLEMTLSGYPATMAIRVGCDGESENLTATSVGGNSYVAKYAVRAGKNYIVETALYSPAMGSFKIIHSTVGSSCDMPFTGKEEGNILPATAGKYWYRYTTSKAGFMLLTSDAELPGGNISVYKTCSENTPLISMDGYFTIRCKVDAGTSYLICIEKTEDTEADEAFDITVKDPEEGDSPENPIVIDPGTFKVSPFDGTYYYKITVPEGDTRFLIVDAQAAKLLDNNSSVKLYKPDNMYSPVASGKDYLKFEAVGGASYYIVWSCSEGYNAFDFKVFYEEIAQGDVCSNPLTAVTGVNELSAGIAKYYQYQATKTGWLLIDTDVMIGVSFPRGCDPYSGDYAAEKVGTVTKMEIVAGTGYLIKFANVEGATQFTVSEEEYKEGETCGMAISVEGGATELPEAVLNIWYQYVATQDGMVTIDSDIVFEQTSDYRKSSLVSVKTGDCSAYPVGIIQSNSDGTWFEGKFVVQKDDVLYINIVTCSAQTGRKLNIGIRDLLPGEACSLPIALAEGEVTFPEANRSLPVWYNIRLQPGDFSISSESAFTLSMYRDCEDANSVAQSGYYYDPETEKSEYRLTYTVADAGTYLLKLEMSYANTLVHVSGSAIVTGMEKVTGEECSIYAESHALVIRPDSGPMQVEVYDLTGKMIHSGTIHNKTLLSVPAGFYIVKAGGRIQKLAVGD